jgi:hypothetical protein
MQIIHSNFHAGINLHVTTRFSIKSFTSAKIFEEADVKNKQIEIVDLMRENAALNVFLAKKY